MTRRNPPLLVALAAFVLGVGALAAVAVRSAEGRFLLLLDDAYTHLSIGRTLAASGVWGISPEEPGSASSSILWPILVAPAAAAGSPAGELGAVLLAAISAALLLVAVDRFLRSLRPAPSDGFRLALLLTVVFGGALPTLVLTGMEHTLHALAAFLLCEAIVRDGEEGSTPWRIPLLAAFATAVRYESVFLVAAGVAVLAVGRRWRSVATLLAGGALPPLLFAAWSLTRGLPAIPSSILAKAYRPSFEGAREILRALGGHALRNLVRAPHLPALLLALGLLLAIGSRERPARRLAALVLLATLLHVELAAVGWLHRYEAYLIPVALAGLAALLTGAHFSARGSRVRNVSLALVALSLAVRAVLAVSDVGPAAADRLRKHVLPIEAVRPLVAGRALVVNDIGIASWISGARVLDLVGLAGREEELRLRGAAAPLAGIDRWARAAGAGIAVLETDWQLVRSRIPPGWILVESRTLPADRVFGDRTVAFYAIEPGVEPRLREALRRSNRDY